MFTVESAPERNVRNSGKGLAATFDLYWTEKGGDAKQMLTPCREQLIATLRLDLHQRNKMGGTSTERENVFSAERAIKLGANGNQDAGSRNHNFLNESPLVWTLTSSTL